MSSAQSNVDRLRALGYTVSSPTKVTGNSQVDRLNQALSAHKTSGTTYKAPTTTNPIRNTINTLNTTRNNIINRAADAVKNYTPTPKPTPAPTPTKNVTDYSNAQVIYADDKSVTLRFPDGRTLGTTLKDYQNRVGWTPELANAVGNYAYAEQERQYQDRLSQAEQARLAREQEIQRLTTPEYRAQLADEMKGHMAPAKQAAQDEAMKRILQEAEKRGLMHSGWVPEMQQKAMNQIEEYFGDRGLDIAQQAIQQAISGQGMVSDDLARQLAMERAALEADRGFDHTRTMDYLGLGQKDRALDIQSQQNQMMNAYQMAQLGQRAHEFDRGHTLDTFRTTAPYSMPTYADQMALIRMMVENWGVPEDLARQFIEQETRR